MKTNWYHEVGKEWLEARRNYITATEIAKLVPAYKRAQKLKENEIAPEFAALWAEKNTYGEVDTASYGAAARGHWMEWFAVDDWNKWWEARPEVQPEGFLSHWDDCIITKGSVGFSPDAMNIEQTFYVPEMVARDHEIRYGEYSEPQPSVIMEIKSYEPAHHMKCCIKDKMDQDELIQLAVAFYVLDYLDVAQLCFYCPGAPISMKVFSYSREELEEQINLVCNIIDLYRKTVKQCKELAIDMAATYSEDTIYKNMIEETELNKRDNILGF